jgi:N-methylhydantoinase A
MIISADTGGTFTDFVYVEKGEFKILKVLSTPGNPANAVLKGKNIIAKEKKVELIHGSTVATNAVLERKGAKTAIIMNSGFEDVIEIGRQNRPELYNLFVRRPEHLVTSQYRFGVSGRINKDGEIIEKFDETGARAVAEEIKELGIESVAVCFLFSFVNPEHEERMRALLFEAVGRDIYCSLSHEIMSEFREFERCSTTTVNAYVQPKMRRYISDIEKDLGEENLVVMQSNGGRISSRTASREPVRTILSGPAGGAVGAFEIAKLAGVDKIITFDMGGTSTDVALINGELPVNVESTVSNYPLKVPMIEIHTVGAGGGSIAYLDEGDALKVGPESAGADPGPICYGKGNEITVTDANLFLGRLIPEHFLGGNMPLDKVRLNSYFKRLSEKAGLPSEELAEGICTVANSVMERAVRVISVDRGFDPADFVLCSFGGAGGLHAVSLARLLNMPKVFIPRDPGILSAKGMLLADCIKDYSQTLMLDSEDVLDRIKDSLLMLENRAVEEMETEGIKRDNMTIEKFLDMRYKGQSYEIIVPFTENMNEAFHEAHEKRYGYRNNEKGIEIVNIRVKVIGEIDKPQFVKQTKSFDEIEDAAWLGRTDCIFDGLKILTDVVDREKLRYGNRFTGPAIVIEYSSTIVIPPDTSVYVDEYENLVVNVKGDNYE